MTTKERLLVIGIFANHTQATRVVTALHQAGFHESQIEFIVNMHAQQAEGSTALREEQNASDVLHTLGLSAQQLRVYQEALEEGHELVVVHANHSMQDAFDIMQSYGALHADTYTKSQLLVTETVTVQERDSDYNPNIVGGAPQ